MEMEILIEELTPNEANIITEASTDGKDTWLSGIFMQADIKNRNGRLYPVNEISAAVNTARQRIKESKGLMGELDHPQSLTINLDRVSHVITEMNMNGSNAFGKAKVLSTPMGNIAKELATAGVSLGVSSRGAGSVNETGGVSQFQFVTVDIVAQPSAPNAYPSTVYESLMEAKNGHNILDLSKAIQEDVRAQEYFKTEITKWLNQNLFKKK
jgi:hypothetical protein